MSALHRTTHAKRRISSLAAIVCLPLLFGACGNKSPEEYLASAKTFLAKNDRKAAVIQIKNAIQADPKSGEARLLFGSALLDGGDPVQAEVELRKALALGYSQDAVVPKLASSLLGQGQPKKLIDEFAATQLTTAGAKAALATDLARAYAGLGDLSNAETKIGAALSEDPKYVPALLFRSQLLLARKDFKSAATVVADALQIAPGNAEAWRLKGDIDFLSTQDVALALVSYRKSIEVKPEFVPGHISVVKALLQQHNVDESQKQVEIAKKIAPRDPQVRYLSALLAYLRKDRKAAQDQVTELLKIAPDNLQVLMLAGSIELETKSLGQAQAHLARAVDLASDNTPARRLLMVTYLRSGQPDKAISVLNGRRASNKEVDPSLYSVAGDAYLQTGDAKTAQTYFEKAAKLDPQDMRKRTALGIAQLSSGDDAAGFAGLQEAAAADAGISADIALISAYMGRQEIDKALKAIDALERKQAGQPVAPYLRGSALLARRDLPAARKSYDEALVRSPTYFPAVMALTSLDISDRKFAEAKTRLLAYLEKEPKNAKALLALAEVDSLAGATKEATIATIGKAIAADPADVGPRLALVDVHVRAKDAKQAMAAAQEAVTALPDNPVLLDTLGRVQQQAGEKNQAIKSFTRLTELQPESAGAFMHLAQAQFAAKALIQAEQSLNRALALQADFVPAQQALAALYVESGQSTAALKIARTVQTQRPKESVGYRLEGDIDSQNKDFAAAATAYRAGLKQSPSADLAIGLHASLGRTSNPAEAERFSTEWQRLHPDDPVFLFYVGDQAMRRKDLAAAEAAYAKVTKIQPRNAAAYNNLAWIATQVKRSDAVTLAEKANTLAPGQPAFMDTLSAALASQGQTAKALDVLKKAVDLPPFDSSLRFNLAKLYLATGDKGNARTQLRQLQELGSAFASQDEIAQLLKTL